MQQSMTVIYIVVLNYYTSRLHLRKQKEFCRAHWLNYLVYVLIFRLDALALSVIATATWLGGCHTQVLYQHG